MWRACLERQKTLRKFDDHEAQNYGDEHRRCSWMITPSTRRRFPSTIVVRRPGAGARPHAAAGNAQSVRLTTSCDRPTTVPCQRRRTKHAPRPKWTGVTWVGSFDFFRFTGIVTVERAAQCPPWHVLLQAPATLLSVEATKGQWKLSTRASSSSSTSSSSP